MGDKIDPQKEREHFINLMRQHYAPNLDSTVFDLPLTEALSNALPAVKENEPVQNVLSDGSRVTVLERTADYLSCIVFTQNEKVLHYEMWLREQTGSGIVLPDYEYTEREITKEQAKNLIGGTNG